MGLRKEEEVQEYPKGKAQKKSQGASKPSAKAKRKQAPKCVVRKKAAVSENSAGAVKPKPRAPKKDPLELAKSKVRRSVPKIVQALIDKAKEGSCPHAKAILDVSGVKHLFERDAVGEGSGEWAKAVLAKLEETDATRGQQPVLQESESLH